MLQYFKRPWMIQPFIDRMVKYNVRLLPAEAWMWTSKSTVGSAPSCQSSSSVFSISPAQADVPLELLVNVDHPSDREAWALASYNTSGLVVPVFSFNVHEVRSYNRLAHMARGDILILV